MGQGSRVLADPGHAPREGPAEHTQREDCPAGSTVLTIEEYPKARSIALVPGSRTAAPLVIPAQATARLGGAVVSTREGSAGLKVGRLERVGCMKVDALDRIARRRRDARLSLRCCLACWAIGYPVFFLAPVVGPAAEHVGNFLIVVGVFGLLHYAGVKATPDACPRCGHRALPFSSIERCRTCGFDLANLRTDPSD